MYDFYVFKNIKCILDYFLVFIIIIVFEVESLKIKMFSKNFLQKMRFFY